jgi:hypothetical protein
VIGKEMDLNWDNLISGGVGASTAAGVIYATSKLFPAVSDFLSSQRKSKREDAISERDENRKEASFLQERYETWIMNLENNLKEIKQTTEEKEKSRIQLMVDVALKDMDIKLLTKQLQEKDEELSKLRNKQ